MLVNYLPVGKITPVRKKLQHLEVLPDTAKWLIVLIDYKTALTNGKLVFVGHQCLQKYELDQRKLVSWLVDISRSGKRNLR